MKPELTIDVAVVGAVVRDQCVVERSPSAAHGKPEVEFQDSAGGGAANALRAARQCGIRGWGVFFTGDDPDRFAVEALVAAEFPRARCVSALERTRRSVIWQDSCFTQRFRLTIKRLPYDLRRRVAGAEWTVVAPATTADFDFVADVLAAAKNSILQLSEGQLLDREAAVDLASRASLVCLNHSELALWTGRKEVDAGINVLTERGVDNLVVTSERGVTGQVNGVRYELPVAHRLHRGCKVGAGDAFVGGLAAALARGDAMPDALRHGLAAARRRLGRRLPGLLADPIPVVPRVDKARRAGKRRSSSVGAATLAASVLAGLALGWFAASTTQGKADGRPMPPPAVTSKT